jgi:hypothetical protein
MKYEQERGHTVHTHHKEREMIHHEHEQEIELLKENSNKDRHDVAERARQNKERDVKVSLAGGGIHSTMYMCSGVRSENLWKLCTSVH